MITVRQDYASINEKLKKTRQDWREAFFQQHKRYPKALWLDWWSSQSVDRLYMRLEMFSQKEYVKESYTPEQTLWDFYESVRHIGIKRPTSWPFPQLFETAMNTANEPPELVLNDFQMPQQ